MIIEPTGTGDIPGLQSVLEQTGLFPPDLLPDMLTGDGSGQTLWLTAIDDGQAIGLCHAVPEALTEGTWNMLALAVLPARQGQGIGGALVKRLEGDLRLAGHRLLIVDTSGTPEFARTRDFYASSGYAEEARIRDFWAAGDDKVVFRKAL